MLPISLIVLLITAIFVDILGQIYFWSGVLVSRSLQMAKTLQAAFGGFTEELLRSFFVGKLVKRIDPFDQRKRKAENYISGLAFFYGGFEAARLVYGLFSQDWRLVLDFIIGEASRAHPEIFLPQSPLLLSLFFALLITRYHIHALFLTLSITAFINRRWWTYLAVLLLHFATNLGFGLRYLLVSDDKVGEWIYWALGVQLLIIVLLLIVVTKAKIKLPSTFKYVPRN